MMETFIQPEMSDSSASECESSNTGRPARLYQLLQLTTQQPAQSVCYSDPSKLDVKYLGYCDGESVKNLKIMMIA